MKEKPQLPIGLLDKPAKKGKYVKKKKGEEPSEERDEDEEGCCSPGITLKISLLLPETMQPRK